MTPYYEHAGVTLYHGDCREILPSIEADVLITDPPYGVGLKAKRARNKGGGSHEVRPATILYEDTPETTRLLLAEAIPLALAVTSRALIFSGFAMIRDYPPAIVMGAVHLPAGSGYTPWGFQTSQPILYYGADPYLADGKGNRPNGFIHRGGNADPVDHPCPKPLGWMRWAVERASRPGEVVLDPFSGSGTTLQAAKAHGRRAVGIEIEERYCEIAATRLAQEVLDFGA